jgi:hypothetical protein
VAVVGVVHRALGIKLVFQKKILFKLLFSNIIPSILSFGPVYIYKGRGVSHFCIVLYYLV